MGSKEILENTVNQAISDFDGIKAAIQSKGVTVPDGTDTKDYGGLIRSIVGEGVDLHFDPDSIYAQSGKAVKEALDTVPIKYVESLDTNNPLILRDFESGTYILYGKFKPNAATDTKYTFSSGQLVSVRHGSLTTCVQVFFPPYNAIQYLNIYDDKFERKDAKLYYMESTTNKVTEITESATDDTYPSTKAVYQQLENLQKSKADKSKLYTTNTISDYPIHITDHLVNEKYKSLKIWGTNNKNLIAYPYTHTTKTENGITFTDNGDGTITANGTATEQANFYFVGPHKAKLEHEKYFLSCLTQSGKINGVLSCYVTINIRKDDVSIMQRSDTGDGVVVDMTDKDCTDYVCYIRILKGTTVNNLVFKPQLEIGTQATEFVKGEKLLGTKNNTTGKYDIVVRSMGKNLITYPYYQTTKTENGITFTDNGDGTVTVNGTATAHSYFRMSTITEGHSYKNLFLSGCPANGSVETYAFRMDSKDYINNKPYTYYDVGKGINVTSAIPGITKMIRIMNGTTVNNLTFKPQLEFGTQATSFEKGFETICSIQLNEPLGYGEYIDIINKKLYKGNSVQDVSIIGELTTADSEANNIVCNTMYAPSKIEVEYWQDIKKHYAPLDENGKISDDYLYGNITKKDITVSGSNTATCTDASKANIKNLEISGLSNLTNGIKVTNMPLNITVNSKTTSISPKTSANAYVSYLGKFYYSRVATTYTDKIAYNEKGVLTYYKNTVKLTFANNNNWTLLNSTTDETTGDTYYHFRWTTTNTSQQIYTFDKMYQSTCFAFYQAGTSLEITDGTNTQFYNKPCIGMATSGGTMYVWLTLPASAATTTSELNTYLTANPITVIGGAQNPSTAALSTASINEFNSICLERGDNTVKFTSIGGLGCEYKFTYEQSKKTTIDEAINVHDTATNAHSDIRESVTGLQNQIVALKRNISYAELLAMCEDITTATVTTNNADGVKSVKFTASATTTHINKSFDCEPFKTVLCEFYGKTNNEVCTDTAGGYIKVEFYDKSGVQIGTTYDGDVLGSKEYGYHRYGWLAPKGTKTAKLKIVTKGTTIINLNDFSLSIINCMPRRGNESGIIYDAHLGMDMIAPRNTMIGFEMAKQAGFTSFITNIQPTKDSVLVALHDDTINATSNGTGAIANLTYAQASAYDFGSWFNSAYTGSKLPKLETVIQFAALNGMHPILRLTNGWNTDTGSTYMTQIYNMLKKYGLKGKATVKAFDINILTRCYGIMGDSVKYMWCLETNEPESWVYTSAVAFEGDLTIEPMSTLTETCANTLLSNDLKTSAWTVNSPSRMRELAKMGITRFCTDTFSDIVFPMI